MPAYELPEFKLGEPTMMKEWSRHQAHDFAPTARQQLVMHAVARALDKKLFYSDAVRKEVAADLGVTPEQQARNTSRVEGGDFGFDVYYARQALEQQRRNVTIRAITARMELRVGDKIGTIVSPDRKLWRGVKILAVSEDRFGDMGELKLAGSRGAQRIQFTMHTSQLYAAMCDALERGERSPFKGYMTAEPSFPIAVDADEAAGENETEADEHEAHAGAPRG